MRFLKRIMLCLLIILVYDDVAIAQEGIVNTKMLAAKQTLEAWYKAYDVENGKGFWDQAEMIEGVLDAYEVTKDPMYIARFNKLYRNFIASNKDDWMYNDFNDDITWAVLFCVRGYNFTGNKAYLLKAKDQFDKMYARAYTKSYGGGLIWKEKKTSKNACINGPAMVACCYLAEATGDEGYYNKAVDLYKWSKIYLFDPKTGKVNDGIDMDDNTQKITTFDWSSTYNQGTFMGAAILLYKHTKNLTYLNDAKKMAGYIKDTMYKGQVMNNEVGGDDLPGFKGIFVRYARSYMLETKEQTFTDWMLLNARTAYENRNSLGLIHTKWATKTPEGKPESAFGGSTAVSLLMNTLPFK